MAGHGHVTPNPDGSKARCGGPALCSVCAREAASYSNKEKNMGAKMPNLCPGGPKPPASPAPPPSKFVDDRFAKGYWTTTHALPPTPCDPRLTISPGVEKCGPDVRGITLFIPIIAVFVAFAIGAVGFALGLLAGRTL